MSEPQGWFVDGVYVPAVGEVWPERQELAHLALNADGTPTLSPEGKVLWARKSGSLLVATRPYDLVPPAEVCPHQVAALASFESLRQAIRGRTDLRFRYAPTEVVPGLLGLYALHPSFPAPLGCIYYRHEPGKRVALVYLWVLDTVRRCGLANQMLAELERWNAGQYALVTAMGNELSTPWMLQAGFTHYPEQMLWTKPLPGSQPPAGEPAPEAGA